MNTLYYAPGACSLSVHLTLEWIGEPYRAIRVNPGDEEYKRLNPAGQVPSLEIDGGELLTQCSAILGYLAHTHPEAGLLGDTSALAQAKLARWSAFFTGDVHPAFFPVFMPKRYTTDESEEALQRVREAGLALVRKRLDLLDAQLADRDHIVGDSRTYVDAYSVPMVRWASSMLPEKLDGWAAVKRHHEALLNDPAVRTVMADEGLIKADD